MTLEMLEFRKDGKVVCVCSAANDKALSLYVQKCREKFNLDSSVEAFLRRFESVPLYRMRGSLNYKTVDIKKLDV